MRVYERLATLLIAAENCAKSGNAEWEAKHRAEIKEIAATMLPHGSGIDAGTEVDDVRSHDGKLILSAGFHHMDEGGVYDGWTEHEIIVTASLAFGFSIRVTGRDRNGIKDYLAEAYDAALREDIKEPVTA